MWPILGFFIFGLAVSIERIWSLTRASINTKKFNTKVQIALKEGGVEAAKEVCENTRGPIASIFMRAFRGSIKASSRLKNQLSVPDQSKWLFWNEVWCGYHSLLVLHLC